MLKTWKAFSRIKSSNLMPLLCLLFYELCLCMLHVCGCACVCECACVCGLIIKWLPTLGHNRRRGYNSHDLRERARLDFIKLCAFDATQIWFYLTRIPHSYYTYIYTCLGYRNSSAILICNAFASVCVPLRTATMRGIYSLYESVVYMYGTSAKSCVILKLKPKVGKNH